MQQVSNIWSMPHHHVDSMTVEQRGNVKHVYGDMVCVLGIAQSGACVCRRHVSHASSHQTKYLARQIWKTRFHCWLLCANAGLYMGNLGQACLLEITTTCVPLYMMVRAIRCDLLLSVRRWSAIDF